MVFHSGHSTCMAMIDLADKICSAETVESSKQTIGIFSNLSKAFDTIDHEILLCKIDAQWM